MPPAKAGEVTIIMIAALKSSFFMTLSLGPALTSQPTPNKPKSGISGIATH